MRSIRARAAGLLAAVSLLGALPAATGATDPAPAPQAMAATRCSSGYRHAVLPSGHKCLRVGQFCARRYNRYYHRYGFHCKPSRRLTHY